jgi:hypothetical protein
MHAESAGTAPSADVSGGKGTGANAIPPNYRQLVARKLATAIDLSAFRDPKISTPVERNVSEFGFDAQPSVCVQAVPVHGGEYPAWIFVFQNGQVSRERFPAKWRARMIVPSRMLSCRGLDWSPFPEFNSRT